MKKLPVFAMLALLLVGAALRFARLDTPVWGDEIASWAFASRAPFLGMLHYASHDPTPPLYYALLHFTIPLFGHASVGLRFPSVFFGVLLLAAIYWSMRQALFSRTDGLCAVILAAASSVLIYYSQEARAYAMLALWSAVSVGLLFRCLKEDSLANDLMYACVILTMSYTHRYGLFLIVAQAACVALCRRWRTLAVSGLTLGAILVFLLLSIVNQAFSFGPSGSATNMGAVLSLINSLSIGTIGMQHDTKIAAGSLLAYPDPLVNRALLVAGPIVFSIVCLLGAIWLKKHTAVQRRNSLILWVCILVPSVLGLLAGGSLSPRPQWLLRGLIFIWPLYHMATAAACAKSRIGLFMLGIIIVLNGFSLYPYYTTYVRFSEVAALEQLDDRMTDDDLIVSDPWYMYDLIRYYYHGSGRMVGYDHREGWIDVEHMRESNEPRLFFLDAVPCAEGDIYAYYRREDLEWAHVFPDNDIYVYNSATASWRSYEGTEK